MSYSSTREAGANKTNARGLRAHLNRAIVSYWLWILVLAGILLGALYTPGLKHWLDSRSALPAVADLMHMMQGTSPSGARNSIRVADQFDPARAASAAIKTNADDVKIAHFFAKKYRLAASEIEKYLHYIELAALAKGLDPMLLMAVMSIESNLNPITESPMGAQGLMQVLTAVHADKFTPYGGAHKVFDPEANIMVGAIILADCIKLGGSVEMGLKCYVGATGPTDNGYGAKVLAEKERIEKARLGVFDFSPNNKILIDMGLLAANTITSNSNNAQGVESNLAENRANINNSANNTANNIANNIVNNAAIGVTNVAIAAPSQAASQLIPSPVSALPNLANQPSASSHLGTPK